MKNNENNDNIICPNCGTQNSINERICKNCDYILTNTSQQQAPSNAQSNTNSNNITDSNMKKWAILSIVIPVVGMIWYWFIGLSFYLAIIIAVAGFSFASKGEKAAKTLAIIGRVLNGILCAMAFIMLILQLISMFVS